MSYFNINIFITTSPTSFSHQRSLYDWLEERLEIQSIADDILSKYVPPHVNIFYCFGGLTLTVFIIQVATGFALTVYYRPSVLEALGSIKYIMYSVNFGWLIRSVHRTTSELMILLLLLHISRVYLTAGFKKPRELTWITGIILALTSVSLGVTGYSLPWDQVSYWACKIVTATPSALNDALPGVGSTIFVLLVGGNTISQATLTRFYQAHTFILPAFTFTLLIFHFLMIRKQGISGPLSIFIESKLVLLRYFIFLHLFHWLVGWGSGGW